MTRPAGLAALLCLVLLAAGCATRPPPPAATWSAEEVSAITRFSLRGKVGFRRGDQGGSAALVWEQAGDRYDLAVSGPLGQGSATIRGNDLHVMIESKDGRRASDEPEALLAEALGWPVSVNHLAYWVRGVAAPGSAATITGAADGTPARIEQDGWVITLDRYASDGRHLLPHRIVATGGDSRVTLLVERWQVGRLPSGAPATGAGQ